ncbi:dnaJ homolog subfamily C member 12 isoform X1 [Nematostella vectensis]|uniref:dnaJ homolog subfamily C member 12 isoform X1 n=1 Tax=Nematostella vectensis TaxID=45351 RepID=UPI00138FCAFA|nr:dnaJ homolog subfamily C member 12 isoform X1 [Nematostella vectensis]
MAEDVFKIVTKTEELEDFYSLLDCGEYATNEQINTEFKKKAKEWHPDKKRNDTDSHEYFARLKKARDVLCDEKMRAKYDHWRHIQIAVPFEVWMSLEKAAHASVHWAPKPRSQLMITQDTCYTRGCKRQLAEEHQTDPVNSPYGLCNTSRHSTHSWWGNRRHSGHISKFRKYEI